MIAPGPANDETHGMDGDDFVVDATGEDKVYGDAGADTLRSGEDNDVLYGGAANDKIYGEGDDDILWGSDGNDVLVGGSGKDKFFGENNNDTINAQDGAGDNVDCGTGTDVAYVDPQDAVSGNCESKQLPQAHRGPCSNQVNGTVRAARP